MIVVGEASGDSHAAHLVDALRSEMPDTDFTFFGSTGPAMRTAGVETIVRADDLAITGILEIGKALPMFWGVFRRLKTAAFERKPDLVILVDFPDFNLKLAKSLKKRGLKVIYYVSPQLWAWRSYRIKSIKKYVDLLLAILPFEEKWYAGKGVEHVEFVGHPLVGEVTPKIGKDEFCRLHKLDPDKPIIALLPGSRRKEVTRLIPPMFESARILMDERPELQFVLAAAPNRELDEIRHLVDSSNPSAVPVTIVQNETREAVAASDAAVVASGTATLETGLLNTPMVIIYKVSGHNWHLLRHIIDVPHFGLINLIAEERLAKELIQHDCTPEKIAAEVERLIEPHENASFRAKLREISAKLGKGGASKAAADAIKRFLKK